MDRTLLTEIPLELPGRLYRSPMPFSLFDPQGILWEAYRRVGVQGVVVLVPEEELAARSGLPLLELYRQAGMEVFHLPSEDFGVPDPEALAAGVRWALQGLREGRTLAAHCYAGLGRTGLFLACLARARWGWAPHRAIAWVRRHVPGAIQTEEQEVWVYLFEPEAGRT